MGDFYPIFFAHGSVRVCVYRGSDLSTLGSENQCILKIGGKHYFSDFKHVGSYF